MNDTNLILHRRLLILPFIFQLHFGISVTASPTVTSIATSTATNTSPCPLPILFRAF